MYDVRGAESLPLATRVCLEAAARLGIEAEVLDPELGFLLELRRDGARQLVLGSRTAMDDAVAARIAKDKHYTVLLLERAGFRVPATARCLSPRHPSLAAHRTRAGVDAGLELADRIGYPVVVKPNRVGHGRGVSLVEDRRRLPVAVREVWEIDAIALVQARVEGRDFRLDFLDDTFLVGYERRPLRVRGDGRRTLADLLTDKDPRFADPDRRRRLAEDPRWRELLDRRGWTFSTVPKEGAALVLEAGIHDLEGPTTGRIVERVPEAIRALGVGVGKTLGLRHFGIDLRIEALDADPASATIVEVNASPQLAQIHLLGHHESAVRAQMRVLEALFG